MEMIDRLNELVLNITNLVEEKKKDNKVIIELRAELKESLRRFNTETHILVERDKLAALGADLKEMNQYLWEARDYMESAETYIQDGCYELSQAEDMQNVAYDMFNEIWEDGQPQKLKEPSVRHAFKKAPAKKIAAKKG
jgi:C4-dicarboxylate-specific signal transduction histidine kinase